MKYSLKNKQFRKRNTIFGQRKKEESSQEQNIKALEEIVESWEDQEESKITVNYIKETKKDQLYKYINFQHNAENNRLSPFQKNSRRFSSEHRPSRHGLSPINKPLLDNPNIRLAESQTRLRYSKNFDIDSQTVNFCYKPQKQSDSINQMKSGFLRLCSVMVKNNARIDQLQMLVTSIIDRGQLISKQLNQGMKTALKIQEQTALFFNTMRSVYQNLRICKLKQENLELYFKQDTERKAEQPMNDRTVKINKQKFSLAAKQYEEQLNHNLKDESKELAKLIDYQSDSSFTEEKVLNEIKSFEEKGFKKAIYQPNYQSLINQNSLRLNSNSAETNNIELEQSSPFEANRMFTNSSANQSRYTSTSFLRSPIYSKSQQSQFQTFRLPNQNNSEYQKIKNWLQKTNQIGLKCWLDEMGCLRRPNNTYIFNEKGEVLSISSQAFNRCIEEGYLGSVYDHI